MLKYNGYKKTNSTIYRVGIFYINIYNMSYVLYINL